MTKTLEPTTSIGLARYAKDFLEAALAVDDSVGMREEYQIIPPIPVLYLVGHSIELALKAFLVHKACLFQNFAAKTMDMTS